MKILETEKAIYLEDKDEDIYIPRETVFVGQKWIKRVYLAWSYRHVLSWSLGFDGKERVYCSETNCIVNKDHRSVV